MSYQEEIRNLEPTYWEDLRVPVTATQKGGSNDPTFAVFRKNTGGTSQGVFAFDFSKTTEQELYFAVQLPHGYQEGSTLHPHVHWGVKTTEASGTVVWGLEYTWTNIEGDFGVTSTVYGTHTMTANEQYKHQMTTLTNIAGTAKEVSSMLLCRVFRDVANDNFDNVASMFEFDFHFEQDSLGTREITSK